MPIETNSSCIPPEGNDEWTVVGAAASGEVNRDGRERTITAGEDFELPARSLLLPRR